MVAYFAAAAGVPRVISLGLYYINRIYLICPQYYSGPLAMGVLITLALGHVNLVHSQYYSGPLAMGFKITLAIGNITLAHLQWGLELLWPVAILLWPTGSRILHSLLFFALLIASYFGTLAIGVLSYFGYLSYYSGTLVIGFCITLDIGNITLAHRHQDFTHLFAFLLL